MAKKQKLPKEERFYRYYSPKYITQTERIMRRFGGPNRFLDIAHMVTENPPCPRQIRRWLRFGLHTDGRKYYGLIQSPNVNWPMIWHMARVDGIVFKTEELDPRPVLREGANYAEKRLKAACFDHDDAY
jgi:hypothetical protein